MSLDATGEITVTAALEDVLLDLDLCLVVRVEGELPTFEIVAIGDRVAGSRLFAELLATELERRGYEIRRIP